MAHCPFDKLGDLSDCLEAIRAWPDVREPARGVFYLKRVPFLHFHVDREGRRWADIRDGADWGTEVDVPIDASRAVKQRFIREARRRYAATAR